MSCSVASTSGCGSLLPCTQAMKVPYCGGRGNFLAQLCIVFPLTAQDAMMHSGIGVCGNSKQLILLAVFMIMRKVSSQNRCLKGIGLR